MMARFGFGRRQPLVRPALAPMSGAVRVLRAANHKLTAPGRLSVNYKQKLFAECSGAGFYFILFIGRIWGNFWPRTHKFGVAPCCWNAGIGRDMLNEMFRSLGACGCP